MIQNPLKLWGLTTLVMAGIHGAAYAAAPPVVPDLTKGAKNEGFQHWNMGAEEDRKSGRLFPDEPQTPGSLWVGPWKGAKPWRDHPYSRPPWHGYFQSIELNAAPSLWASENQSLLNIVKIS